MVVNPARDSVVDGVCAAIGGASPMMLHENWCRFKEDHGWTYGPVKDEVALTHPCLVTYDELPADQQIKDRLFQAIVAALA